MRASGLLLLLACAACQPSGPGLAEAEEANLTKVDPLPQADPDAAERHAKLCSIPSLIAGRPELEATVRPTPKPSSPELRRKALAENTGFWPLLREAAVLSGEPADLTDLGASASVRDFLAVGILARFRVQEEPGAEAWGSLADAYEAALRIADRGAVVHLEAAHEIVQGLLAEPLPEPPAGIKARLEALANGAPRPADILDRERISRLNRFSKMYLALPKEADLSSPEVQAYVMKPKQPILDARSGYWTAWAQAPKDEDGPEVPDLLKDTFGDDTEEPDAMRSYREHAFRLAEAGRILAGGEI